MKIEITTPAERMKEGRVMWQRDTIARPVTLAKPPRWEGPRAQS
jgi:hypothetical protein